MVCAIITARGGSKRLPRKNVRLFCGVPLVAWAVIQARCSNLIDKVFVSTDDDEIESISKEYGAEVIRRPLWPDADLVAANRPFIHAMEIINERYPGDHIAITILPTTPLNLPGDFDTAIETYIKLGADVVMPLIPKRETVLKIKTHPFVARAVIFDKSYKYLDQAGGYTVCSFAWYKNFVGNIGSDIDKELDKIAGDINLNPKLDTYYFPVKLWQNADVDTLEEFEFAEIVMERFILKGGGPSVYFHYLEEYSEEKILKEQDTYLNNLSFGNANQL